MLGRLMEAEPTVYPELNAFLDDFVAEVRSTLGSDLVGVYLVGSFALRDGDMSSDCDFLVVMSGKPDADEERALRALHDDIPTRPGYWAINFEGSYAPRADLESLDRLGRPWLFVNRGHREMEWSAHCNVEDTRWVLRERAITLSGHAPETFAAEVPGALLQDRMRRLIPGFLDDLHTWADFDLLWTQRYAVESICRMLYTLDTGQVTSKRRALEWAREALPGRWTWIIEEALADRSLAWNDPSDPQKVAASIEFARFAGDHASG